MRTEMARFLAATAVPSRLSLHPRAPGICPREPRAAYLYMLRMEEPGRFHDATLVRIGRPSLDRFFPWSLMYVRSTRRASCPVITENLVHARLVSLSFAASISIEALREPVEAISFNLGGC